MNKQHLLFLISQFLTEIDLSEIDKLKLDIGRGNPQGDSKEESTQSSKKISSLSDVYSSLQNKGFINKDNIVEISRMLDADSHAVKFNGGVVDQTGKDGLDKSELNTKPGEKEQYDQRARSTAALWLKESVQKDQQLFGATEDSDEHLQEFKVQDVLTTKGSENLILKVCLPIDNHIMAVVIRRENRCRDRLIDQLESESAVLQPFALVEGNMHGGDGVNEFVAHVRSMRNILITNHQRDIQDLENKVMRKVQDDFVVITLPGSSKKIKIKAKEQFNASTPQELSNIQNLKFLDFSRMKVIQDQNKNATLIDKDFQKSFLRKQKDKIISEVDRYIDTETYRFKEASDQLTGTRDAIEKLNAEIDRISSQSNDILLVSNDPRFRIDFKKIQMKQKIFQQISEQSSLLSSIKKDQNETDISDLKLKITKKLKELTKSIKDNNFINKWQYESDSNLVDYSDKLHDLENKINELSNRVNKIDKNNEISNRRIYKLKKK